MKSKKRILLVVRIDIELEMEEEFNQWYSKEHISSLPKVPRDLSAKRGINTGKGPKYVAVYEHENIDAQHSEAYRKVAQTEGTRKLEPNLLHRERKVYELL